MKTFTQLGNTQTIKLKGFTSTKVLVLLGWLLSLSLITCAQELKIGDTHKEKVKGAIIYSKYVTNAELNFPSKNITSIKMNSGAGFLEVVPSENEEISLEAEVVNAALSRKDAEKFIDKYLHLSMENINGELVIESFFQGLPRKRNETRYGLGHMIETPGSKIHVVLKVPAEINLNLYDRSGSINMHDLKNDIYLKDRSGYIKMKNIEGNIELSDHSGPLSISNTEGDLKVKDGSGSIYLDGIGMEKGNHQIEIYDRSGLIDARGLGGDLIVKDASGGLNINLVTGSVEVIDGSGELVITETDSYVKVKDTSGKVYLKDIAKNKEVPFHISVTDGSGEIYLSNAGTDVVIKDRSGSIRVKDIQGDVEISDRSGEISAREISGKLKVKDHSGKIHADNYMVSNK
ncbi:hypothetical protein [Chondrinema litorale]|uniref:hypothetical protein n=1 Tax=Chondrinema litorale TaxID=2994555 RepID=UPI002543EFE2|nr:hypothetical protein [Chondrinema litorale]UZR92956.1 hypothetical protein OQ292_13925 [Chondrinema litorale]